jgi:hypothetical protein
LRSGREAADALYSRRTLDVSREREAASYSLVRHPDGRRFVRGADRRFDPSHKE